MELLLKLKIDNLFKDKDFMDKDTGTVKPAKWKIQTFEKVESEQGEMMKLENVSITDEFYEKVKGKVGEVVTVPVKAFVNGKKIGYYGI